MGAAGIATDPERERRQRRRLNHMGSMEVPVTLGCRQMIIRDRHHNLSGEDEASGWTQGDSMWWSQLETTDTKGRHRREQIKSMNKKGLYALRKSLKCFLWPFERATSNRRAIDRSINITRRRSEGMTETADTYGEQPMATKTSRTKRFILVRHGETDFNVQKKVQGRCIDISLNDTGRKQAERLGERLKGENVKFIACSTLKRAIETTDIVINHFSTTQQRNYHLYEGLVEMSFGPEFEGKHFDRKASEVAGNIHNKLASIVKKWVDGELDHIMPGGESPLQVEDRARKSFAQIKSLLDSEGNKLTQYDREDDIDTYLIICHGRLLKILICSLLDIGLENMEKFQQNNTAVNILEWDEETKSFTLQLLNCTAHLEEPPNN
ncbi:hypothetical protein PROFUN_05168 [Planoprotostelium fungivorum]|uniref:Phosphoglycerate mutase family protein n=1 Tax=Planoprotostelium fungivorum TaxID=1890364 RepID=A0A2P6NRU4_9EUKA|nr:hypothetical protein PROFUN_05168 [Planoprotostelium fungivorum]